MVFNENENDSSKNNFDDIADIFPLKESVSIKVRVLRMWKVPAFLNPSIPSSIEMVLIDQKGGKIHASIRKQLIHVFEAKIEEGMVYEMSHFSIFPQLGSYRTTLHPHKLLFQLKTTVKLSDDSSDINKYGFNFTEIAEICANSHGHEFLVEVIGYMSGMSAEKEYIRDGKITKMVIFELTDHSGKCDVALFGDYFAKIKTFRDKVSLQNVINTTRLFINPDIPDVESFKNSVAVHGERTSFLCELDSDHVEEFRNLIKSSCDGLPILVLQFVELTMSQGYRLVKGIKNITRMFMNPATIVDPINFRKRLVDYLTRGIKYTGLLRSTRRMPMSYTLDFIKDYPVVTIDKLNMDPKLGLFVVNARIADIVSFDPWWYPVCKCSKIFDKYIGTFHCVECGLGKFLAGPKVKLTFRLEDETGTALFKAFDHVAVNIAEVNMSSDGISGEWFQRVFSVVLGKSLMFIVKKTVHEPMFIYSSFDLVRVTDHPAVFRYYDGCGFSVLPSKDLSSMVCSVAKNKRPVILPRCTTTTADLIKEYLTAANNHSSDPNLFTCCVLKRARE
ncbi:hypothetical protein P8452_70940 [Trifolium repens]|nr:hypothetical protein P8452_70940 [Trifolium repens]